MGFGALLKNLTTGTDKKEREEMERLLKKTPEMREFMQSDAKKHPNDVQAYTPPGAIKKKPNVINSIKKRNRALKSLLDY